jgi:hypothetical protein
MSSSSSSSAPSSPSSASSSSEPVDDIKKDRPFPSLLRTGPQRGKALSAPSTAKAPPHDPAWPPVPEIFDPEVQEFIKDSLPGPEDHLRPRMPVYHPLQMGDPKKFVTNSKIYLDGTPVKGRPVGNSAPMYLTGHAIVMSTVLASTFGFAQAYAANAHRPKRVKLTLALNTAARSVGRYVPFIGFCVLTSAVTLSAARWLTRYRHFNMPVEPLVFTWAGFYVSTKWKVSVHDVDSLTHSHSCCLFSLPLSLSAHRACALPLRPHWSRCAVSVPRDWRRHRLALRLLVRVEPHRHVRRCARSHSTDRSASVRVHFWPRRDGSRHGALRGAQSRVRV